MSFCWRSVGPFTIWQLMVVLSRIQFQLLPYYLLLAISKLFLERFCCYWGCTCILDPSAHWSGQLWPLSNILTSATHACSVTGEGFCCTTLVSQQHNAFPSKDTAMFLFRSQWVHLHSRSAHVFQIIMQCRQSFYSFPGAQMLWCTFLGADSWEKFPSAKPLKCS